VTAQLALLFEKKKKKKKTENESLVYVSIG